MQRSRTNRRRGEGHLEYVALTSLIMVCALTSMMAIVDSQKMVALERQLCISCPARMSLYELDAEEDDLANTSNRSEEQTERLEDLRKEQKFRTDRLDKEMRRSSDETLAKRKAELQDERDRPKEDSKKWEGNDKEAALDAIVKEQRRRDELRETELARQKSVQEAERKLAAGSARSLYDSEIEDKKAELEAKESLTNAEQQTLQELKDEEQRRKDNLTVFWSPPPEPPWALDLASWFTGARGFWEWLSIV